MDKYGFLLVTNITHVLVQSYTAGRYRAVGDQVNMALKTLPGEELTNCRNLMKTNRNLRDSAMSWSLYFYSSKVMKS